MHVLSAFSSKIVMIKKNFLVFVVSLGSFLINGLFENSGGVMHPFLTFWLNIALDLRQMRDYRLAELVPQVVKNFDHRVLKNQEVAKGHSSRQKLPVLEVYISFTSSLFILGLEFRIYVVMKYKVQVMYEILLMFSCLL